MTKTDRTETGRIKTDRTETDRIKTAGTKTARRTQRSPGLTCVTPNWPRCDGLSVVSSTRLGGYSQQPYAGLNLGLHVNDDAGHVQANRQVFAETWELPAVPQWLNQVHGTRIVKPGTPDADAQSPREITEADGAWTDKANTVLAVVTADCLPVVIVDNRADSRTDNRATSVAVVHAGWRGLAAGVLEAALGNFPTDASLQAWLGPAIGPAKFEVGADVYDAFVSRLPEHRTAFAAATNDKYFADIYRLATAELQASRVISVYGGEYCTVSDSRLFYSYRRDGVKSGRMATMAWLSEQPD